ncbi:TatD family hydrolase [Desulfonatronospira sp.]|uniref:TatD family hydrolase n=1 Tax=Desulfonatronospira sp. TaxID=1962951 RepID=UPI0025C5E4F9|nr:TatD family hydrolase [Desulfonatronospira sp.]
MGKKKNRPTPQEMALPPGGADSHAHLDFEALAGNLDQVLDRAEKCGVSTLGQVFLGPDAYLKGRELFSSRPEIFYILGVHPHEASTLDTETSAHIYSLARDDERIKAVGETGLDFFYNKSSPQEQRQAFKTQLELTRDLDLPVVIHSRDAAGETLEILKQMGFKGRKVLWHCFGQDLETALEILDHGWFISIPGSITFARNTRLREILREIPVDRLMLETDCPFIAPEPYRGKQNEPALLVFTAMEAARSKGMDAEELWTTCGDNCRSFFGVKS